MKRRSCALLIHQFNCFSLRGISFTHKQTVLVSIKRQFSQWHLVGAVCLERKPVISQPLNPLEEKYSHYIQKLEIERSYLSDHEKRLIEDQQIAVKLKAKELEETDAISTQTAQDFEDTCLEEFKKYQPASRTTDADIKNDRKSIKRKLDSTLLLVVNQKIGNDFRWLLPQAVHQEGETLRQTAERALDEVCISKSKVQFLGNAPVGYYKYKYPKVIRGNGVCGAKVFFFKAQLFDSKKGFVELKQTDYVSDHLWLTHQELEHVLQPVYCKVVQSFLYPDVLNLSQNESAQNFSSDEEEHLVSSAGQA